MDRCRGPLERLLCDVRQPITAITVIDYSENEGPAAVIAGTSSGEVRAFSTDGALLARHHVSTAITDVRAADLDVDGRMEIVWLGEQGILGAISVAEDARAARRAEYMSALAFLEEHDETSAQAAFSRAGLGWVLFDDSDLGAIRARLKLSSASPSAHGAALALDRLHRFTSLDWLDAVSELMRLNRVQEALALSRERFVDVGRDALLAKRLNEAAWQLVDPGDPRPTGFEVGLVLAKAAARASAREDPRILLTLSEALYADNRVPEAITAAEEALARCPSSNPTLRGWIAASLQRYRAEK